jgi:hypothetical protein
MRAVDLAGGLVEVQPRHYLTDAEMRRWRDMTWQVLYDKGIPVRQIARTFNVTPWTIYKRLATMPEPARRRAEAV